MKNSLNRISESFEKAGLHEIAHESTSDDRVVSRQLAICRYDDPAGTYIATEGRGQLPPISSSLSSQKFPIKNVVGYIRA